MSEALQGSHSLEATKDPKLHRYLEADDHDLEDKPLDYQKSVWRRPLGKCSWTYCKGRDQSTIHHSS